MLFKLFQSVYCVTARWLKVDVYKLWSVVLGQQSLDIKTWNMWSLIISSPLLADQTAEKRSSFVACLRIMVTRTHPRVVHKCSNLPQVYGATHWDWRWLKISDNPVELPSNLFHQNVESFYWSLSFSWSRRRQRCKRVRVPKRENL